MREEEPLDPGDVRASGVAQLLIAAVGQARVGDPGITWACAALDQSLSDEPIDQPRDRTIAAWLWR